MGESPIGRILNWLRAGYPDGIPQRDYPPVLLVLRRNLTDGEIESVADELALQSIANNGEPVTGEHIRQLIHEQAFQNATAEDIRRVSAALASGGWPLSSETA